MPTSRPLRVLVAEDHPVSQRLVQAVLAHRGHRVVVAASGREALAAFDREAFDVVLMDIQMPDMDGFQATAAMRARESANGAGGRVRILAMTAHSLAGDRDRCLAAGMDGYIAKPVSPNALIEILEEAPSSAEKPPQDAPPAALGGSDPQRRALAGLFLADALQLTAEMREAIARGDAAELRRAAHQLVGSAGYFAAQRVTDLAERLEALAKAGDLGPGAQEACEELAAEVARLERTLAASPSQGS